MLSVEIRPAVANDLPRLMALDHSCTSDYVWQMELRTEGEQVSIQFREVRLPRSIQVAYPRDPFSLADEWMKRDVMFVALHEGEPVGYLCAREERASSLVWVTDLVVSAVRRRQGVGSALLSALQAWASERSVYRLMLEMQSKNHPYIRLAQKFGYEFCGYNDRYYPTQDVTLFFGRAIP
ncbi:MAG TPA: GNAT family N-acetyltransferase [Anaerolineales bacterium]|nr:GNAT family N-acetyltransferase [Anaerolineales bacterium]